MDLLFLWTDFSVIQVALAFVIITGIILYMLISHVEGVFKNKKEKKY